jgi:hypothetical protein
MLTADPRLRGSGAHRMNFAWGILASIYGFTYYEYRRSGRRTT